MPDTAPKTAVPEVMETCEVSKLSVSTEHSVGLARFIMVNKLPFMIGSNPDECFGILAKDDKVKATISTDSDGLHHIRLADNLVSVDSLTSKKIVIESIEKHTVQIYVDGDLPLIITCRVEPGESRLLKRPNEKPAAPAPVVQPAPTVASIAAEISGPLEDLERVHADLTNGMSIEQICAKYNHTVAWFYLLLHLDQLGPKLKEQMRMTVPREERIPGNIGEIISRVPDHEEQWRIWEIVREEVGSSVRKLKALELVKAYRHEHPKSRKVKTGKASLVVTEGVTTGSTPATEGSTPITEGPAPTDVEVRSSQSLAMISSGMAMFSDLTITELVTLPNIDTDLIAKLVALEKKILDIRQKAYTARTLARGLKKSPATP